MILVDTSVWVEHLRSGNQRLTNLLDRGLVLAHPFVTGELALGNIAQRDVVIGALQDLPQASVASDNEVLDLIDRRRLFGLGIGYIDAHLLAAVLLSGGAGLWTYDRRLHNGAQRLGLAAGVGS